MSKRKRGAAAVLERMVRRALKAIVAAKGVATGQKYRRLHRIESELATVEGRKSALKKRTTGMLSGRFPGDPEKKKTKKKKTA